MRYNNDSLVRNTFFHTDKLLHEEPFAGLSKWIFADREVAVIAFIRVDKPDKFLQPSKTPPICSKIGIRTAFLPVYCQLSTVNHNVVRPPPQPLRILTA